ncbi:hypothetical protein QAD02_019682 [Eretmocerus hayati]|uniref:Uncharacterized protein n=1 Tax=Eretmocerus hayati TaxID=131215 RepID=A0ACC2PJX7_9HYME|nr:hypothetical protein QAD02_019682 [Eretmocerus hayati]
MQPKCSHEENRAKVCGPCGKKIVLGKMRAATRISGAHETLIRKLISDDFNLLDSKFPLSICTTCRLTIIEHSQNRTSRPLPQMPNYQDMIFLATRSNDGTCNCYICLTARSAVHLKNVKGRGSEREFNIRIDVSNGLFGRSSLTSLPRNKKTIEKAQNRSTTCTICRGEIRKGIRHSCGSGSVVDNSVQAIDALSEAQKQRVISKLLKRQINKVTDNEGTSSSNNQNCEVRLKTGGPEMRVVVKPKKMKMFTFDSKSLDDFRISTGVSFNHMIKMTSFIRRTTGKNSIPSHYRERMSEQSKILDSHYKSKVLEFDVETTPVMIRKQRPVVYVDAEELLEFVLESRNMIGDFNIKVFTDSGQGSLKMSMSIFPSSETNANDTDDINLESSRSSRKNKSELTGVHKLLLIAIVPSVKETYENLRLLFDLTNINNLPYKFLADFKVYHLVNGQQTSRASFPCPYCFISLNDLKDIESVPDKQDNRFHGAAKSSAPYYDLESSAEAQDIENEELNGVLRSWKLYDDLENITPDDSEIVVLNSNKENECEENTLRPNAIMFPSGEKIHKKRPNNGAYEQVPWDMKIYNATLAVVQLESKMYTRYRTYN